MKKNGHLEGVNHNAILREGTHEPWLLTTNHPLGLILQVVIGPASWLQAALKQPCIQIAQTRGEMRDGMERILQHKKSVQINLRWWRNFR